MNRSKRGCDFAMARGGAAETAQPHQPRLVPFSAQRLSDGAAIFIKNRASIVTVVRIGRSVQWYIVSSMRKVARGAFSAALSESRAAAHHEEGRTRVHKINMNGRARAIRAWGSECAGRGGLGGARRRRGTQLFITF